MTDDILKSLGSSLTKYIQSVSGAESVFVATLDGHILIDKNNEKYDFTQIAPMSGSILSVAETITGQLMGQELQDNIILTNENVIAMFKIKDKDDSLFLACICKRQVSLGQMITFAKTTIREINQSLEQHGF